MVGSAEKSSGGVSSVIKLMKKMPFWSKYQCYWLGTQIQGSMMNKLCYALRSAFVAPFVMWRFDIIHFHTTPDKIGLLIQLPELLIAKLYGKKVVYEVHVGNQLNNHTQNGLFKWCMNKADIIALLANKWVNLLKEKYPDVNTPSIVVYNSCGEVRDVNMSQKEKIILFAGTCNPNKSPDILIKAWNRIHDLHKDWRIIFMGYNEFPQYTALVKKFNLEDSITFTGWISGAPYYDYWRKSSVLVMCSYNEGFPMVVLEAWSNGLAVITTPVGGLPDVIDEGKNCLSFPFGDDEMLAEQLERVINDRDLRYAMAIYGHDYAKSKFSLECISRSIDNVYTSLMKK